MEDGSPSLMIHLSSPQLLEKICSLEAKDSKIRLLSTLNPSS